MNYCNIIPYDFACGDGVRCSLFVSGCNFHCPNCFNKEAQEFNYGKLFTLGDYLTILNIIKKPQVNGLSILGGDPLWQNVGDINKLVDLVYEVKQLGKTTWLWSGFTWEELAPHQHELVDLCDVFIDGRYVDELRDLSLYWRGSSNQRVINVQETLKQNKVILY